MQDAVISQQDTKHLSGAVWEEHFLQMYLAMINYPPSLHRRTNIKQDHIGNSEYSVRSRRESSNNWLIPFKVFLLLSRKTQNASKASNCFSVSKWHLWKTRNENVKYFVCHSNIDCITLFLDLSFFSKIYISVAFK